MPDSEDEKAIQPKPTPHPKELSPEYHKAHKQLMLWAAILFVWEFVGIDLDKAKDAEGYAGAVVKSIKSPQAVPWVLLFLVSYFLFKCSTEWAQCHTERRKMRFARVDFVSALIVALAAIALYVGQAISRVQIADVLQSKSKTVLSLVYGASIGVCLINGALSFWRFRTLKERGYSWHRHRTTGFWVGAIAFALAGVLFHLSKLFLMVGALTGAGATALIWYLMKLWRHRRKNPEPSILSKK
jgi:phosphatidylglycerophosphate synthase